MSTFSHTGRRLRVQTPLGDDFLLLQGMSGREAISRLYAFDLRCISDQDDIKPKEIVGKNITVALTMPNDQDRFFNGYVTRISHSGKSDRYNSYSVDMVPWLWFLTRRSNCRIFQNKTVPEIVEQVFKDAGFSDFETAEIKGKHPKWEYCVQYRETDFNFVSRLMEHEGIFYYFRHENGKHIMVLADSKKAYKDCDESEVDFAHNLSGPDLSDHITAWEHSYSFTSGKFAQTDYNFETPATSLTTKTSTGVDLNDVKNYEIFDYPSEYEKKDEGETDTNIRMEEVEAAHDVVVASSVCRTFGPGGKFKIGKHAIASEEGKRFAITSIQHNIAMAGTYISGEDGGSVDYTNTFTCIPDTVTYRPPRITPKPVINGMQSAVVVGPAGDEIYTDKFGRVKVQFFWDRLGKADDKSSCFLRVATTWAGKNWGAHFLPRIGMEVLISFLEGDPDRPLVTGCVYNAANMPPYPLPDNMTMSTLKSISTKGGDGFNEFRFEDKKGSEHIFIHGEKDLEIRVKNDRHENIDHDRHLTVGNDKVEHIKNKRHETVDSDHMEEIKVDRHLKVGGKEAVAIAGSKSLKVTGDVAEVFQANHSEQVTSNYYLKADNIVIEALTNITIKVGQSYIAIEAGGIKLGTTGTLEVESTGPLSAKSSAQAEIKAPQTSVSGDAMLTLKGGQTLIN